MGCVFSTELFSEVLDPNAPEGVPVTVLNLVGLSVHMYEAMMALFGSRGIEEISRVQTVFWPM
jgi:hypothetical protein